jgi:hypothetical protein
MADDLAELIASGRLPIGTSLYHPIRTRHYRTTRATVVAGGIEVSGKVYGSPSAAARAITGNSINGWRFWRVESSGEEIGSIRGA